MVLFSNCKLSLQVKMINDSVLGEYTCVARNGLGSATKVSY